MTTQRPFAEQYPALFAGLTAEQTAQAERIIANHRLEGWDPTEAELRDLLDAVAQRIDRDEYMRRGFARIAARHPPAAPA